MSALLAKNHVYPLLRPSVHHGLEAQNPRNSSRALLWSTTTSGRSGVRSNPNLHRETKLETKRSHHIAHSLS